MKCLQDILNDPEVKKLTVAMGNLRKQLLRQYHPDLWPEKFKTEANFFFQKFEKAFEDFFKPFNESQACLKGEINELDYFFKESKDILFLVMIRDYKERKNTFVKKLLDIAADQFTDNERHVYVSQFAMERIEDWHLLQTINRKKQELVTNKNKIKELEDEIQKLEITTMKKDDDEKSSSYSKRRNSATF